MQIPLLSRLNQWVAGTALRSLDEAYQAALAIQQIEDQHFEGQPVASHPDSAPQVYGENTLSFFQSQINQHLSTMRIRLAEFRASSPLANGQLALANPGLEAKPPTPDGGESDPSPGVVLEKLALIDTIQTRYRKPLSHQSKRAQPPNPVQKNPPKPSPEKAPPQKTSVVEETTSKPSRSTQNQTESDEEEAEPRYRLHKTGFLPRSLIETAFRLTKELSPGYEQDVLQEARDTRSTTITALKFIFLLMFIPLLTQIATKNFVISPAFHWLEQKYDTQVTLNLELNEQALAEIRRFQEMINLEQLLGQSPQLSDGEQRTLLKEKAIEILANYQELALDGIKNLLADLLSLGAFAWLIFVGREEVRVLKQFIDQIIYGISDSAKAFIIILLTDIFVGYHSPHGWEVLLTSLFRHFGLPENQEFNYAFIATFPVVLDTLFKYWIFRYLNRLSPSAVATYKNMNE